MSRAKIVRRIKWKKLGKELFEKRKQKALTLEELAKELKLGITILFRAERGTSVSADSFVALVAYMGGDFKKWLE